jgi:hypothetical protein
VSCGCPQWMCAHYEAGGAAPCGTPPVTMADLTPGTRVRHPRWGETGTIRQADGVTEIRWDTCFGEAEVSPEGPVLPGDLEIVEAAP